MYASLKMLDVQDWTCTQHKFVIGREPYGLYIIVSSYVSLRYWVSVDVITYYSLHDSYSVQLWKVEGTLHVVFKPQPTFTQSLEVQLMNQLRLWNCSMDYLLSGLDMVWNHDKIVYNSMFNIMTFKDHKITTDFIINIYCTWIHPKSDKADHPFPIHVYTLYISHRHKSWTATRKFKFIKINDTIYTFDKLSHILFKLQHYHRSFNQRFINRWMDSKNRQYETGIIPHIMKFMY